MKVGLFMAPQWAPDANMDKGLTEVAALVRAARHNGFSSLLIGQHMVLAPIRMYQPIPLLAWLAREAEGMLIGPGVALLSMLNPVQRRRLFGRHDRIEHREQRDPGADQHAFRFAGEPGE